LDTVFLEQDKKSVILKTIDDFIKAEQWYLDNGIPYHLGILLYGSPGTGKSSLIKAIASYMNYDIYYLPVSSLAKLEDCMDTLPEQSIIVIEDIDCEKVLHTRSNTSENSDSSKTAKQVSDIFSIVNFSDVLNVIDGVCSAHGRILISTTNHIEKLDPALIRPGRIDLKVELGYVNSEIFNQFSKRFFGKEFIGDIKLKERLSCAELQNLILQKKSYDEIISFATHD
jgi:chaperone BCS1